MNQETPPSFSSNSIRTVRGNNAILALCVLHLSFFLDSISRIQSPTRQVPCHRQRSTSRVLLRLSPARPVYAGLPVREHSNWDGTDRADITLRLTLWCFSLTKVFMGTSNIRFGDRKRRTMGLSFWSLEDWTRPIIPPWLEAIVACGVFLTLRQTIHSVS